VIQVCSLGGAIVEALFLFTCHISLVQIDNTMAKASLRRFVVHFQKFLELCTKILGFPTATLKVNMSAVIILTFLSESALKTACWSAISRRKKKNIQIWSFFPSCI
jgi:hypothetical protein